MRIARSISSGTTYHVISRFVDREWYFRDDEERANYLRLLGRALDRSDWRCLSYALMSNHIHLALIAGERPMWTWLKRVHSPFANWMNQRHTRLGPLFAHRPNAWAVRPEHVPNLIAYIHNNPVRAGVVERAADSAWTSHRAYVAKKSPCWLDVETGLTLCKLDSETFDSWVAMDTRKAERESLGGIHREARKRGAIEVGTPTADPTVVPLLARHYARIRPDPRSVIDELARILQIAPTRISSRSNEPSARRARALAVHAARTLGLTVSEISSALGLTRQTGSRLAQRALDDVAQAAVTLVVARFTTLTPSLAKVAQVQEQPGGRR